MKMDKKHDQGDETNGQLCRSSSPRALGSPWMRGLQVTLVNAEMVEKEKQKSRKRESGNSVCLCFGPLPETLQSVKWHSPTRED